MPDGQDDKAGTCQAACERLVSHEQVRTGGSLKLGRFLLSNFPVLFQGTSRANMDVLLETRWFSAAPPFIAPGVHRKLQAIPRWRTATWSWHLRSLECKLPRNQDSKAVAWIVVHAAELYGEPKRALSREQWSTGVLLSVHLCFGTVGAPRC